MSASQHSDGRPDGQVLGQSASDKIAFHGATPVVQASFVASAGALGSVQVNTTNSGFTFATSSGAAGIRDTLEAIRVALINKGILPAS
jgi:hypothetical protein